MEVKEEPRNTPYQPPSNSGLTISLPSSVFIKCGQKIFLGDSTVFASLLLLLRKIANLPELNEVVQPPPSQDLFRTSSDFKSLCFAAK